MAKNWVWPAYRFVRQNLDKPLERNTAFYLRWFLLLTDLERQILQSFARYRAETTKTGYQASDGSWMNSLRETLSSVFGQPITEEQIGRERENALAKLGYTWAWDMRAKQVAEEAERRFRELLALLATVLPGRHGDSQATLGALKAMRDGLAPNLNIEGWKFLYRALERLIAGHSGEAEIAFREYLDAVLHLVQRDQHEYLKTYTEYETIEGAFTQLKARISRVSETLSGLPGELAGDLRTLLEVLIANGSDFDQLMGALPEKCTAWQEQAGFKSLKQTVDKQTKLFTKQLEELTAWLTKLSGGLPVAAEASSPAPKPLSDTERDELEFLRQVCARLRISYDFATGDAMQVVGEQVHPTEPTKVSPTIQPISILAVMADELLANQEKREAWLGYLDELRKLYLEDLLTALRTLENPNALKVAMLLRKFVGQVRTRSVRGHNFSQGLHRELEVWGIIDSIGNLLWKRVSAARAKDLRQAEQELFQKIANET